MSRRAFDRAGAAPALASAGGSAGSYGAVRANGRRYLKWIFPLGVGACYAVFAVAVHLRLLDSFDLAVREASRPGVRWGTKEIRSAQFVRALRPTHLALPLLLIVVTVCMLRRSLRPFWAVALVGVPAVLVTLGTKWAMRRLDPGIYPVGHGSFPSGHMVAATMAVGVVVLIVLPGTRWGWLLPAVMGCSMGSALILGQVHPVTDVVGAGLLIVAALSGAAAAGVGQWASGRAEGQRRMTSQELPSHDGQDQFESERVQ